MPLPVSADTEKKFKHILSTEILSHDRVGDVHKHSL